MCIAVDVVPVFEHQEDMVLKLHGELRKMGEVEAHGDHNVGDLVALSDIIPDGKKKFCNAQRPT